MEQQIVQAVDLAAGVSPLGVPGGVDPALQAQAIDFINQLQANPQQVWAAGWSVFQQSNPRHSPQARIFGLTLVTSFLASADASVSATGAATTFLQQSLLTYVQATYCLGQSEPDTAITSKLAQTITHLLAQSYAQSVPSTLLPDLFSLLRSEAGGTLNVYVADLVLKALHDLSLTLGSDVTIRAAKDRRTLLRDSQVKDAIRAHHAATLSKQVWSIAEQCLAHLSGTESATTSGLDDGSARGLLRQALICAGDYASWLDISLMVTPQTVTLLMQALHLPSTLVRGAAADALLEVVLKGMKPADKQQLLSLLGLTSILAQQERTTRAAGTQRQLIELGLEDQTTAFTPLPDAEDEVNIDFRERIAKLVDGVTTELGKIIEDTGAVTDAAQATASDIEFFGQTRQAALEMLNAHLPLVLCFLADEADGPTEQVLPSLHAILALFKKTKRRVPTGTMAQELMATQQNFLTSLMTVVGHRLKFGPDQPWTGLGSEEDTPEAAAQEDDAPDSDEAAFVQLRSKLQQVVASVAGIDETLFATSMQSIIVGTLTRYEHSVASNGLIPLPSWQGIEVGLYCTYVFGEVLSATSSSSPLKAGLTTFAFVDTTGLPVLAPGAKRGTQPKVSGEQLRTLPLSALGETIQRVMTSGVAAFSHPAVQLQLFETLVRYSAFFQVRPALLQDALSYFLDPRGIHRPEPGFRKRVSYLLGRFVRETRTHLAPSMVAPMLENMQDVLVIHAELPAVVQGEDPLEKVSDTSAFDSQLHLFNVVGILLAAVHQEPERQSALLSLIVSPLAQGLTESVQGFDASGRTDVRLVLQVHHLILAMSTLAKGFPEAKDQAEVVGSVPVWIEAFKQMTEHIMSSVAALRAYRIVREAGRGAFARIINTIGRHALPFVPLLIDAVLSELSPVELVDSLSFLSMLINKYHTDVQATLDDFLLGLLQRTFVFLNQPITGTDESLERTTLQKSYIALIHSLVSAGLDGILLSPKNQAQLQPILESLLYYAGSAPDKGTQRNAVGCLSSIVSAWGTSIEGFETFCYERFVPLAFEAPAKPGFDLGDAQAQQVVAELATLVKRVYAVRGQELIEYLLTRYFPSINCPEVLATQMAQAIQTLEAKLFKGSLIDFARASNGTA